MEKISLPEFIGFDWDNGNNEKTWLTHNITVREAEQVLFNRPLITVDDQQHSQMEKRYFVLGQTDERRPLFIAFTMRKQLIRVISARNMHKKRKEGRCIHHEENSGFQE